MRSRQYLNVPSPLRQRTSRIPDDARHLHPEKRRVSGLDDADTPSHMRIRGMITADCHSHFRAWRCMLKQPQTANHVALIRILIACAAMTDLALPAERRFPLAGGKACPPVHRHGGHDLGFESL